MKIVKPSATLLAITPNALELIERAGRVAYKSEDKIEPGSAERFIETVIMRKGHHSVLEHAVATFHFVCDRGVSHELVRHRLASYTQESTRYCNYSKEKFGGEISVILPPIPEEDIPGFLYHVVEHAESKYLLMIEDGIPPQIARAVLPTCLKTEIIVTANFREWLHIFDLRCAPEAHPQIRELMSMAREQLRALYPCVFGEEK